MIGIERIERGIHYRIARKGGWFGRGKGVAPDEGLPRRLAGLLHDRMTESWFDAMPDPAGMFRPLQGQPLLRMPLLV